MDNEKERVPNVARSINSAFDSVNLINGIIDGSKLINDDIDTKKNTVERNYKHLELMKNKDWFMSGLTQNQLQDINDSIQSGKNYISQ